jgi:excisionase family DNA binding protein
MSAGDPDALMDAEGVAQLLHVDLSWVRSATREGVIPSVPLGRWRRYRRSSVLAWVEQLEQPGRPVRLRSASPKTLSRPKAAA